MANETGIEWCDSTFNPWIGCTKVSPACDNCYAEALMDKRMHRAEWGAGKPRARTSEANWQQPLRWNKKVFCACANCSWRGDLDDAHQPGFGHPACPQCSDTKIFITRRRVFCASLADVFDNEVDPLWRRDLFELIGETPNLDWLLLTKRIGNAEDMINAALLDDGPTWPWPNVWIGATICNQEEANRDISKLLAVPSAIRFLSIEPMLGPIDLTSLSPDIFAAKANALTGQWKWDGGPRRLEEPPIDWVIVGGESGAGARPMHPDWVRSLRDQCVAAGVPFLFKQWGEWKPVTDEAEISSYPTFVKADPNDELLTMSGCFHMHHQTWACVVEPRYGWRYPVIKVGKKAAGRMLDGVEHNGYPAVAP